MRRVRVAEELRDRIQTLRDQGAYLKPLDTALVRLARSQNLDGFKDHALRGKLLGYRACHVGMLPDSRVIVMVYAESATTIEVVNIDEHDACYHTLRPVRGRRR